MLFTSTNRKASLPSHMSFNKPSAYHRFQAILVSMIVLPLAAFCIWVTFSAIEEKMRLAQHLTEIDTLVTNATQLAQIDRRILDGNPHDLIEILGQTNRVNITGYANHLKSMTNPWGGSVTAQIIPGARVRIETFVTPNACRHLVGVFSTNLTSTNILRIDASGEDRYYQPIYIKGQQAMIDENITATRCGEREKVYLALLFPVS